MPTRPAWTEALLRAAVVGLLYAAAYRYSVFLRDPDHLGASFWPGAGITVAALLLSRRRHWPAILVAVAAAQWFSAVDAGVATAAWTTAGNVTVGGVCASLLHRWDAHQLRDTPAVARFALATGIATLAGGLLGAFGVSAAGSPFPYPLLVAQWVTGDSVAILTIVPAVIALAGSAGWRQLARLEPLIVLAASAAITFAVFPPLDVNASPFLYLILLPLMWAAIRLPLAVAAAAVFIAAQLANLLHSLGYGPIAETLPAGADGRWQLQLFLASAAIATLVSVGRTRERDDRQQLVDARERLLASVSHELRSPLTPILGFSDASKRRADLDPKSHQAFVIIHRNAAQLLDVIDDLLTFTRGRRNRITPTAEHVDLAEVAHQAAANHGDELTVDAPDPVAAWADPPHTNQIVANLVNNARTHGRAPITIAAGVQAGAATITVTDAGDGVPDEFIAELFDEFAQHPNGHTAGGLGLGLAIARDLARANDGQLRYRHHPSGGAEFQLTLPAATPAASTRTAAEQAD